LPVLLGFGLPVQRRGAWGDKDPVVDAITGGEVEFTEVGEAEESPHASRVEHAFRRSKLRGESENQFCEHVAPQKPHERIKRVDCLFGNLFEVKGRSRKIEGDREEVQGGAQAQVEALQHPRSSLRRNTPAHPRAADLNNAKNKIKYDGSG